MRDIQKELNEKSEKIKELHKTKAEIEKLKREKAEARELLEVELQQKLNAQLGEERTKNQKARRREKRTPNKGVSQAIGGPKEAYG